MYFADSINTSVRQVLEKSIHIGRISRKIIDTNLTGQTLRIELIPKETLKNIREETG